jgi:hypothetical protein
MMGLINLGPFSGIKAKEFKPSGPSKPLIIDPRISKVK